MAKVSKNGKKIGRPPSELDQAILDEIVEWVSDGKTLRDYCRQPGKPVFRTVYDWMLKDESFAARFAKARDTGHDVIADQCMAIADEVPPVDANGKTDAGYVSWQKNRIWTRTQLLSKWNPKKYGDKVGVEHSGNVGLSINIDLT